MSFLVSALVRMYRWSAFSLLTGVLFMKISIGAASPLKYVITETGPLSSYDPLNADQTQNLPTMRMLYLTPLEVSDDDRLRSSILSHFSVDKKKRTIVFDVKSGLSFSNGEPIVVEDVVLSIKRMALTRPLFPVLREIEGISDWRKLGTPLKDNPSGIKITGQRIEIKLSEDVDHPLFRFTLELFSIIPKSCINLSTGSLTCDVPAFSGPYELIGNDSKTPLFRKRKGLADVFYKNIPAEISFSYMSPDALLLDVPLPGSDWVVAGAERLYTPAEMKKIQSRFALSGMAKNRYSYATLNPNVAPLGLPECRRFFAEQLRQAMLDAGLALDSLEGSISPKIISGYQTLSELQKASGKLNSQTEEKCRNSFKGSSVRWGITKSVTPSLESAALMKLFRDLGVANPEPLRFENREAGFDAFTTGKTAVHLGSSGLWALDPFGDLQMFFTPNLHKSQYFSSQDTQMQDLISQLRRADSPSKRKDLALKLNQHIFTSSLFFVYTHSRRFFVAEKGSSLERIPMAISGAAPWQVFSKP